MRGYTFMRPETVLDGAGAAAHGGRFASPEHGFSEGHPGAPAACEGRHHGQRVHAGVAEEREQDGRIGLHKC